jgi:tetratricopeptide (TPR) repeat protein
MPGLIFHGAGTQASWATPEAAQWVERADRYAAPDTPARVWANIGVGELKFVTSFSTQRFDVANEGSRLLIRNVALARQVNDPEAFCVAAVSRLLHASAPQHACVRLKLAEELAQKSRAGISTRTYGTAAIHIGSVLLECGQRRRAEESFNELKEMAERSGQANLLLCSMWMDGVLATLDGRLEDAVAIGQNARARGEQLGPAQFGISMGIVASFMALLYLGRIDEVPQLFESPYLGSPIFRVMIGPNSEVVKILEQWVVARPGLGSADDETGASTDILFLQAAVRVGHLPAAELLLRRFSNSDLRTTGCLFPTCISRHLGAAAALLGRPEDARRYYEDALKVATEMRFRPEIALTRLQLAELLLEHYPKEKADASGHLDFAIKEFREMKMQPSLERALKYL